MEQAAIEIAEGVSISASDLVFKTSRSSGPGGQNVNKRDTRVSVLFDVRNCASLSDQQKATILTKLASRAGKDGVLMVVCQKFRTQKANHQGAIERLGRLLAQGLKTHPRRKKTGVPLSAKRRRLEEKRQQSLLKRQRAFGCDSDDS
jgi:ribosome-associated protein